MKPRLTIIIIGITVLVTSGYWAIKNNIGKSKDVTAFICKGEMVFTDDNYGRISGYSFHSTASILVTAEYYPWQTNKTYSIEYKNGSSEFRGSTNDKSVGNTAAGDGVYVSQSVNQHDIQFFRQGRTTYNNPNWTKKEMNEHWRTSSYGYNLMLNLITMEIKVSDSRSSLAMKDKSGTSVENNFSGNCTITSLNAKI